MKWSTTKSITLSTYLFTIMLSDVGLTMSYFFISCHCLIYSLAILSVYVLYCSFKRIYNYRSPCFVHTLLPCTHRLNCSWVSFTNSQDSSSPSYPTSVSPSGLMYSQYYSYLRVASMNYPLFIVSNCTILPQKSSRQSLQRVRLLSPPTLIQQSPSALRTSVTTTKWFLRHESGIFLTGNSISFMVRTDLKRCMIGIQLLYVLFFAGEVTISHTYPLSSMPYIFTECYQLSKGGSCVSRSLNLINCKLSFIANFLYGNEKSRWTASGKLRWSNGLSNLASSSQLIFMVQNASFFYTKMNFSSQCVISSLESSTSQFFPLQKRVPRQSHFPFSLADCTNNPLASSSFSKNLTKIFIHSAAPQGYLSSKTWLMCLLPYLLCRDSQSCPSSLECDFSMRQQSVLRLTVANKFTWLPRLPMDSCSTCGSYTSSFRNISENYQQPPPLCDDLVMSQWRQLGSSSLLMRYSCSYRLRTRSVMMRCRL